MGQEFELKFAATKKKQAAVLAAYGPWRTIAMETTYFDTPDRALSARHITLRLRKENGETVCTVKTPLSDGSRGEWEVFSNDISAGIAELCRMGAPKTIALLTEGGVEAVCGARFTRQACDLHLQSAEAELALDCGVLLGGGREVSLCEIEVELKSGSRSCVQQFAAELADIYRLLPESKSKFRRAMALAEEAAK